MRLGVFLALIYLSTASATEKACPNYPYETLLGAWYGEQYVESDESWRRWINTRKSDGSYRIEFFETDEKESVAFTEEGLWAYSGCLYTTITERVNGNPALYQEVYRVNEINDSYMDYTNYRTGNNFRLFHKTND